ncbi:MAG: metallophosphoesterase, partial [Planctomycetes bacterium]|nr:metallophosphoesterase [Planctomycetota bacterium]
MPAWLIRRLLWCLGFGCLWLPVLDDPPLRSGVYLQDVGVDHVTVAMITAAPCQLRCTVRDATGRIIAAVDGPPDRRRHALEVGGLEAGTAYDYEVVADGVSVGDGRFHTPPADDMAPVKFAVLGDSGKVPWWVWLQTSPIGHWPARWQWLPTASDVTGIGAAIAAYQPDFLLHLGDVIYPWGQHCHYSPGFFRPFGEVLRHAPCYMVLGNHDVMDAGGLQAIENFHLPKNDVTGDERC